MATRNSFTTVGSPVYSYRKRYVYNGVYVYEISNGSETVTTPGIHSGNENDSDIYRLLDQIKNFKYYVDNGAAAVGGAEDTVCLMNLKEGETKATILYTLWTVFSGEKPTAERVINALKGLVNFSGLPSWLNGFFIGDIAVATANMHNCKNTFKRIKGMI